jgi:hypothetical protein
VNQHAILPIREALLVVMNEYRDGPGYFQSGSILREVAQRLKISGDLQEQALLMEWNDMFRLGIVAPGRNLANPNLPFCHLTQRGRETIEAGSRDPANPSGYLASLKVIGALNDVAFSYLNEALLTYNSGCFKASAVMVGTASETLLLELRDAVVSRSSAHGRKPNSKLVDWRAKPVLDGVADELNRHTQLMPAKLREAFQYLWPAFMQQIRAGRNDAGHPTSVEPVTGDTVHASLLIFPALHEITLQLIAWINSSMPAATA